LDAYAFASQRERTKSAAVLDASLRVEPPADGTGGVQHDGPEADPWDTDADLDAETQAKTEMGVSEAQPDPFETDLTSSEPSFAARFGHSSNAEEPRDADADTTRSMPLQSKIAALEAVIGRRRAQLNMQDTDAVSPEVEEEPALETPQILDEAGSEQHADPAPEVYTFIEDDEDTQASHLNGPGFVFKEHLEPEIPDTLAEAQTDTAKDRKVINMEFEPAAADPAEAVSVAEATQVFSVDEDVLDEEALRDMVAEIVRQELQGALGERITRNVRKLVRREIHRALATQDLD